MRLTPALAAALALFAVPALAEDAATNWSKKCASCHGKTGDAKTKMGEKHKIPDMTTAEWHADPKKDDAFLAGVIAKGVSGTKMKAYDDKLSADEIQALVAYVRAFKP